MADFSPWSSEQFSSKFTEESKNQLSDFSEVSALTKAADAHNIGNNNFSFTSPSTWGEGALNAGKFILDSAISGIGGIVNTGIAALNILPEVDIQEQNIGSWMGALDSSLETYYYENKSGVDVGGFILGSIVPGMLGSKLLNAGARVIGSAARTGDIGINISLATGLRGSKINKGVLDAATQFTNSAAATSKWNSALVGAAANGVAQGAAESFAFELASTAAQWKSPFLEDKDLSDIGLNILWGGALGTVLQGAFNVAKISGATNKLISEAEKANLPFSARPGILAETSAAERISIRKGDLESTPLPETELQIKLLAEKTKVTREAISADFGELTKAPKLTLGTTEIDRELADNLEVLTANLAAEDSANFLAGVKDVVRIKQNSRKTVSYLKLWGTGAGDIIETSPTTPWIGDLTNSIQELKNLISEQGFKLDKSVDVRTALSTSAAQMRTLWAQSLESIPEDLVIHEFDIPLFERAVELAKGQSLVKLKLTTGDIVELTSQESIDALVKNKELLVADLVKNPDFGFQDIVAKANISPDIFKGQLSGNIKKDYFHLQSVKEEYLIKAEEAGLRPNKDILYTPQHAVIYRDPETLKSFSEVDGHVVDALSSMQARQKIFSQERKMLLASQDSELAAQLGDWSQTNLYTVSRRGAGAGFISNANANYGTAGSFVENLGGIVHRTVGKKIKEFNELISPIKVALENSKSSAVELAVINQKMASTTERFAIKLTEEGERVLKSDLGTIIKIENKATADFIEAHIAKTDELYSKHVDRLALQGSVAAKDSLVAGLYYPIKPNPRDYKHVAFVVDEHITGAGHVSMLHARNAEELEVLVTKVNQIPDSPGLKVYLKSDTEQYHKLLGDYEFSRTLHNSTIDTTLRRNGVNSQFFVSTDPEKITSDFVEFHQTRIRSDIRDSVAFRYEAEFSFLDQLGARYKNIASSSYGTARELAEKGVKNPYVDYIKTALDISKVSEYPMWRGLSDLSNNIFQKLQTGIATAFNSAKTDAELLEVTSLLDKYGASTSYRDSALELYANIPAGRGALQTYVRKVNGLLANFTLRIDPLNALNNAIGANVLLGTETRYVLDAITRENSQAVGALADLAKLNIPGLGDILAPGKLISRAMKDFIISPADSALMKEFKSAGFVTDAHGVLQGMLDDITLTGVETAKDLNTRIGRAFTKAKKLGEAAEKYTGNKLAEEFNRFVAAHVGKQISDIAVTHGIFSKVEQNAFINTFVNRTQGNIIASQRPVIFQGAIGQAIGLYQTYQFNLMQQLFRYVAEGSKKDVAIMMGLQSTFYGLQGLPAFNLINQSLVGNAPGNLTHTDLHDVTTEIAGKDVAELLLYGIPSNLLDTGIYTRGDINPRNSTILPSSVSEIPAISQLVTFGKSIYKTFEKISGGADVIESMRQGIEHNGISRPLQGLAQLSRSLTDPEFRNFSTNSKGNIIGVTDLVSLASLSRLAGGRPLDEALAQERSFRISSYQQVDKERKDKFTEALKTELVGGKIPSDESINKALKGYIEFGGKQKDFNRWMLKQMLDCNSSQVNKLASNLSSPYAQKIQGLMGGERIEDMLRGQGN
jgi:hypothetical protein